MSTIRQQTVASKLVENGGKIGMAMIAAGYSPNTAKTPSKLTKSKGWKKLMDDIFPDLALLRKHRQLLEMRKKTVIRLDGITKVVSEIDVKTVAKALDMAFRLKGYYVLARNARQQPPRLITVIQIGKNHVSDEVHKS